MTGVSILFVQSDDKMASDGITYVSNITTTTIHPDEFIGGPRYIAANPVVAYIYIIIATIATVIGFFGNIMVLACVRMVKDLHSAINIFLVNLAIADLIIIGFGDTFSLAGKKEVYATHIIKSTVC